MKKSEALSRGEGGSYINEEVDIHSHCLARFTEVSQQNWGMKPASWTVPVRPPITQSVYMNTCYSSVPMCAHMWVCLYRGCAAQMDIGQKFPSPNSFLIVDLSMAWDTQPTLQDL